MITYDAMHAGESDSPLQARRNSNSQVTLHYLELWSYTTLHYPEI